MADFVMHVIFFAKIKKNNNDISKGMDDMNEFLNEVVSANKQGEVFRKDYVSSDGLRITDCPYQMYQNGAGPDGSDHFIPGKVMLRITEMLDELRQTGNTVSRYEEGACEA